jgi:hypothetical protein
MLAGVSSNERVGSGERFGVWMPVTTSTGRSARRNNGRSDRRSDRRIGERSTSEINNNRDNLHGEVFQHCEDVIP